jgi:hypothetical protein
MCTFSALSPPSNALFDGSARTLASLPLLCRPIKVTPLARYIGTRETVSDSSNASNTKSHGSFPAHFGPSSARQLGAAKGVLEGKKSPPRNFDEGQDRTKYALKRELSMVDEACTFNAEARRTPSISLLGATGLRNSREVILLMYSRFLGR